MPTMSRRLTLKQRNAVKDFLLNGSSNMKPVKGLMNAATAKFDVNRRTINSIWNEMKLCYEQGIDIEVQSKQKGNKVPAVELDTGRMGRIPKQDRRTIRHAAGNYVCSKSKMGRWLKKKLLKGRKAQFHPAINAAHKIARLKWALQAVELKEDGRIEYKSQAYVINIDEKWYYMDKVGKYILLPDEEVPYKSAQSKKHIPKIMFMCAVGRPLYDTNGELLWDGKVGIWPFTEEVPARRNSVNRVRGTIEVKPIASVNKEAMHDMLINKIIPAIKAQWPASLEKNVIIQQDNATPHVKNDDPAFREAADSDGFHMNLVNQPAMSPDCNINDLGFFNSLQSLQQLMQTDNYEDLVDAVQMAYQALEPQTLDDVFISSQMCLTEIMACKGHNNFPMPHMGKERLRRLNILPKYLTVDQKLVMDNIDYLRDMQIDIGNPALLEGLGYEPM